MSPYVIDLWTLTQGWTQMRQSPYLLNPVNSFYTGEDLSMADVEGNWSLGLGQKEMHRCWDTAADQTGGNV